MTRRKRPIKTKKTESGQHGQFSYAAASMQGWRESMEDNHDVQLTINPEMQNWAFAGVFDGHAGKKASEYASKNLRNCILEEMNKNHALAQVNEDARLVCKGMSKGFASCDKAMANSKTMNDNSGTTAVCAMISPNHVYIANCGDSRATLCRKGKVQFATKDHKPQKRIERMRIEKAGGNVRRNRVKGKLAMSRALGDFDYKNNQGKPPLRQMVIPKPDVTPILRDMEADEFLVLACDGIFDVMTNYELITYIRRQMALVDLTSVCTRVLDRCLEKGSTDNMSIVIITFPGCPSRQEMLRKRKADFAQIRNAKRPRNNDAHGGLLQQGVQAAPIQRNNLRGPKVPNPFMLYFIEQWRVRGGSICMVAKQCGQKWKLMRNATKAVYIRRYTIAKRKLEAQANAPALPRNQIQNRLRQRRR